MESTADATPASLFRWTASTLPHRHKYIIAGNHDHGLCSRDDWYARVGNTIHKRYGYELADTKAIKQAVKEWEASGHGAGAVHRYVEDERVTFDLGGRTWSLYGSPVRIVQGALRSNTPVTLFLAEDQATSLSFTVDTRIRRMGLELQAWPRGARCVS